MTIGFLINPVAGMGGKVALKGTDGEDILKKALELGAVPVARARAEAALAEFADSARAHEFITSSKEMGESLLAAYGIEARIIYESACPRTTAYDTIMAARKMEQAGADLIVFAGGDGTARDICSAIGERIPVVGVPAGVKIHSAVYAKKPRDAGMLVKKFLSGKIKRFTAAEVMDIDEDAFRQNVIKAKLYGYMTVLDDREFMQDRKSGGASGESAEAADIAAYVVKNMEMDAIYLIGSGTTTDAVMKRIGADGTLLGVDAVENGRLVAKDLAEKEIKELLNMYERDKRHLVITVIGGQGHIFGRGNQQLSPDVLRMIPKSNINVIATPSKMAQLFGKPLIADTGDAALDEEFKGYIPVTVGFGKRVMAKVV